MFMYSAIEAPLMNDKEVSGHVTNGGMNCRHIYIYTQFLEHSGLGPFKLVFFLRKCYQAVYLRKYIFS